jgi:hypothetical protein
MVLPMSHSRMIVWLEAFDGLNRTSTPLADVDSQEKLECSQNASAMRGQPGAFFARQFKRASAPLANVRSQQSLANRGILP